MDTAATVRAANLAIYGDNYNKEAQGLQLLSQAIRKDGRLELHKSFEKARADCCVYAPGALALGIQLKTAGKTWKKPKTGLESYQFGRTDGYAGLLMVFVALHAQPPRIWLADGSRVVSTSVLIPVKHQFREVHYTDLANAIYEIYSAALSGSGNYTMRTPMEHEKPTDRATLAEYDAFKRLQSSLPALFVDPPAEHMSYDSVVDGKHWQLKLARYDKGKDYYEVQCRKRAGNVGGKRTRSQYEVDDFDFLCVQMPQDTAHGLDCCYLIPQGALEERGLLGDTNKSNGHVTLYPHRPVTRNLLVHIAGLHWTERYRINFADDPLAKLARIVGQSAISTSNGV